MSLLLRLALLITYFGDYCSLIGIMEYAKLYGGSDKVVSIFIAYCFPAVLMALFGSRWASKQHRPSKQLSFFCLLGVCAVLSLLSTINYWHILFVSLVLGFIKETTILLVNVYIKNNFNAEESKHVLNDIVSIRFFIMVFGGSLGGYLGGINRFDLVFFIDATSYILAGLSFFKLALSEKYLKEIIKPLSSSFKGSLKMIQHFGQVPFIWVMLACLGIGSFMALEYPLITTQLGISPKFMGFIYFWHVLGAIFARNIGKNILRKNDLSFSILISSALLLFAFAMVGVFGASLVLVGIQVGVVAFFMVINEVLSSYHLMSKSSQEEFPHYNIHFRIYNRFSRFLGSLIPLLFFIKFDLLTTNIYFNVLLLCFGFLSFLKGRSYFSWSFKKNG